MGYRMSLLRECIAETLGTFILVLFGCGAVFVGVLTDALPSLFDVALVWGVAIGLAIYTFSAISGAHINPAVTAAFAAFRGFPRTRIAPYVLAQVVGAFLAGALLYALFCNILADFEQAEALVRGQSGSQLSAMCLADYYPNPGIIGTDEAAFGKVTTWQALLGEAVGTALLVVFVFALTDPQNANRPHGTLFAPFIGLGVAIIIVVIAPLTMAGLNPARDLGPRLFAYLAGWGTVAIPGPRGGFLLVYILAPIIGGLVGGAVYHFGLQARPGLVREAALDEATIATDGEPHVATPRPLAPPRHQRRQAEATPRQTP